MEEYIFGADENERLRILNSYQILDSEEDEDYNYITELASDICETPISLITFIDDKRQWFKANFGIEIKETPKEFSFCPHAILTPQQPFHVQDLSKDPRFENNPFVKDGPQFVFYAGIPIVTEENFALGTLCVMDYTPRKLTDKQLLQLKKLGRQVEKLLKLRKAKIKLASEQSNLERQLAYNTSLFNAIPDTIMIIDFEGKILEVKSGGAHDFTSKPENTYNKRIQELIPDHVAQMLENKLTKIKNNLPFKLLEYKLITPNGIQTFEANFARFEEDKVLVIIRNISKSKAIEEELFRTKDILLEAGKMARVGAWEVDFINNTHLWSEVTKEIMELGENPIPPVEEGIKLYENDPEGLALITNAFNTAIYEGIAYDIQLRVTTMQGNLKWVRTIGKPIFENGNCVGVFGTFQDITEIKNKEHALKAKTLEYEHLFMHMNQGVVYQDQDGQIISANPAAERILNMSIDQMIGRTSIDPRWHAIKQDGSPFPGEDHPSMRALRTGHPVIGEVMGIFLHELNEYRWILVDALPDLSNQNSPKAKSVLATFTDITELLKVESKLKEHEANLLAIIESSTEAIWSVNKNYNIMFANNSFRKLFQNTFSQEIGVNENVLSKIPQNIAQLWMEKYGLAFEGNIVNFNFEMSAHGQSRHYDVNITPIQVEEKIFGASIFAKDITENMLYILEIEHQNSKLKEIAWKQSHLVRAPLARIMGLALLIEDEKNNLEEIRTLVQYIVESSVDLDMVIRSIVDLSSPFRT